MCSPLSRRWPCLSPAAPPLCRRSSVRPRRRRAPCSSMRARMACAVLARSQVDVLTARRRPAGCTAPLWLPGVGPLSPLSPRPARRLRHHVTLSAAALPGFGAHLIPWQTHVRFWPLAPWGRAPPGAGSRGSAAPRPRAGAQRPRGGVRRRGGTRPAQLACSDAPHPFGNPPAGLLATASIRGPSGAGCGAPPGAVGTHRRRLRLRHTYPWRMASRGSSTACRPGPPLPLPLPKGAPYWPSGGAHGVRGPPAAALRGAAARGLTRFGPV